MQRLAIPLDGSALAEAALAPAATLANDLGWSIHLIRVIDFDYVQASVLAGPAAADACANAQRHEAVLARDDLKAVAARQLFANVSVSTEVRIGNPASELPATLHLGDIVVMTSHGRSGPRRWMLGSTTDQLVHEASVPVLLIHPKPVGDEEIRHWQRLDALDNET